MRTLKELLRKYSENRPLFVSLIRTKEALLFQKYLPLKRPILDLGCGDGFFAKTAFGKLDIGLDVAGSRINESKDVYKQVVVYDGHKIPFKNNSISTVVSNCVLEHIPNLEEVIGEVYRVLKPKGKFITSVMAKPWEKNLIGGILLGNSYLDWFRHKQQHFNLLTNAEWTKVFTNAGFRKREEIGYLSPNTCKLIELFHYLSVPNLITYMLLRKWIFIKLPLPIKQLAEIISVNAKSEESGAIFFVWQK